MKIACLGGGPSGLYFSLLMKKAFPDSEIDIFERNQADDTFGWGVVFSDETLSHFEEADPESFAEITDHFVHWSDIETYFADRCIRSTGHGFCGLARRDLLQILHRRCEAVGVHLHFNTEITGDDDPRVADADLILGADGINSILREKYADHFEPEIDNRVCKFCWLGTDKALDAFTFIFLENEAGMWQVHAYPFKDGQSTWIVECDETTFQKSGLEKATEEDTVAFCEDLFRDHLEGASLLTNRSIWRNFPTIRNKTWHHGKIVLLGDAAHTAHFSIGSGTKLAMEDAIALKDAFVEHGTEDVPTVLQAYEDNRYVDTVKIQKAAQTSLEWFENTSRYAKLHPLQFTFSLMTRSKRITYDNLAERDPDLVQQVREWWWDQEVSTERNEGGVAPPPMFAPFRLKNLDLSNRIVVSPMCQYMAEEGAVTDWHLVHLGSLARGGAGLVFTEMTDVSAEGRITFGCAGMWNDEQEQAWKNIVTWVHQNTPAKICQQLAHAGRKGSCHLPWEGGQPLEGDQAWDTLAPSPIPFAEEGPAPREMTEADMKAVTEDFVAAARRSEAAGFDMIELHMAHGYLLSSFLSPLSNQRQDAYGGSIENRMRFPLEVFKAIRAAWPEDRPLSVRLSATDWLEHENRGLTMDDTLAVASALKEAGCDLLDISSAGNSPDSEPIFGRMFQVPFAERIRFEVGIPVMCVGAVLGADHANTILAAGRADLVAMARPHLIDPHLTLSAAVDYEVQSQWWPNSYLPAKPQPTDPNERRR
ncbi:MAG: bifunctional salicylyl-CoA 5-hydroxylase/oxidoreductase [Planctomycetota bacterium]|nr:bifunctional salicylyl-CoA 5-hydroxylase/oxidoreductase [Planctomycetota bacterium]